MIRVLTWQGVDEWLVEHAHVELSDDGILATGVQLGVKPEAYRLEYRLEVPSDWVTRRLEVDASGAGWRRSLVLEHDGSGAWRCDGEPNAALDGALDCDLAFSPLTNCMPVRRHRLHEDEGSADFVMAWVSVPDLAVHASRQRYEHIRPGVVRFSELDGDFTADLELDADGLVVRYPRLAERVSEPR
ncbi:MAG TPA: putative glycolipid-binding domain-containing protein [Solirubrobacteraceae bacterium]